MTACHRLVLRVLLLAVLAAASSGATAHEVRPAYLELRLTGADTWSALWKVPALGGAMRLRVDARLPEDCVALAPRHGAFIADAYVERWSFRCPDGLAGRVIRFDGLAALRSDVLLRIERPDGRDGVTARVTPTDPRFTVPAEPSLREVLETYFGLGVHHILLGVDHLLFVLALLLIVQGWRQLALTVTAFTLGHTLTLAAATLDAISLPGPPVEAAIAFSIVIAAAEAAHLQRGEPSPMARAPWAVALMFGLLHGLGFAGALREIGLPENAVLPALLFFNIGVEVGQLLFVGGVLSLGWGVRWLAARRRPVRAASWLPRFHLVGCYVIGLVAAFWLVERIRNFWG